MKQAFLLYIYSYSAILVHAIYIQRCEFGLGISLSPTSPQCTHAANRSSLALASFAAYCCHAFHANRTRFALDGMQIFADVRKSDCANVDVDVDVDVDFDFDFEEVEICLVASLAPYVLLLPFLVVSLHDSSLCLLYWFSVFLCEL